MTPQGSECRCRVWGRYRYRVVCGVMPGGRDVLPGRRHLPAARGCVERACALHGWGAGVMAGGGVMLPG